MLAQYFLKPAELRIPEAEFDALLKVLGMLEREEIPKEKFTMEHLGRPECGTPGCILGWARSLRQAQFGPESRTEGMHYLFYPDVTEGFNATREQAAAALRNYLTFGAPFWAEVLAE